MLAEQVMASDPYAAHAAELTEKVTWYISVGDILDQSRHIKQDEGNNV